MPRFLLHHSHEARECPAVFAAWSGFTSPLRHRETLGSCHFGDHQIWWQVEALDSDHALALLPRYVAQRTAPVEVREVPIP